MQENLNEREAWHGDREGQLALKNEMLRLKKRIAPAQRKGYGEGVTRDQKRYESITANRLSGN